MPLTRYPHGIFATPNIGGIGRLSDIWNADNIWFVDGDNGSSGNAGNEPDRAVALISTAIDKASRGGTIYVKPRTTVASAQTYYVDSLVIPLTKPNLSIIGAGFPGCHNSFSGCQLKASDVATDLIHVNGAGFNIENMRLSGAGMTDLGNSLIDAEAAVDQTRKPSGLTVRGCHFASAASGASATEGQLGGAIGCGSVSQMIIEDCVFYAVTTSIMMTNTSGTGNNQIIRGNVFGGTCASRNCDVVNIGNGTGIVIADNIFSCGVPAGAGGYASNFIYISAGVGIVARNAFATATNEVAKATGTECTIPTTFFCAGNTIEAATDTKGFATRS